MARGREWLDRMSDSWAPPAPTDLTTPYHYLVWLARSQGGRVALGATLGTAWTLALTVPPWVLARAVDGLVADDRRALLAWTLVLLATTVLIAALSIARHRTMSKIRMDASYRSVRTIIWQTTRLGARLERQVATGEVVTAGITDVQVVARAMTVTGPGVGAVVALVVVAVVLFSVSPLLAIVVLAGVPLLAIAVGPLLRRIERTGDDYRQHQGHLTARLVDALAGLGVLNGLGGKDVVAERYVRRSQQLVHQGYRVAVPTSWVGALAGGLPALFLAAVVWLSARMAATGAISIGDVVAVHGYVAMLVVPVAALIEAGGDLIRAKVAGRRIIDLLALPVADDAPTPGDPGPRTPTQDDPKPDGLLVDGPTGVSVRPGILTAVVAVPADRARALVDRLGGVADGATWADRPVRGTDRSRLRQRLVVADNDAAIFAGTVRDIVAGRDEPDDDRIRTSLHVAVAEDIVEALPRPPDTDGLDATIAPQGRDLSGGQRQRIRLARAVQADPEVLLAVDPTSAVDVHTEAMMIGRLHAARRGRTTVVTTSSPLVLDRADEVILVHDGAVAAVGTHRHLLHTDPRYRDLVSRAEGDAG